MAAMVGARSRWVVTGTPIGSGGLTDLHGLLRVLQHDPFQDRQLWQTCIGRPYARGTQRFTPLKSSLATRCHRHVWSRNSHLQHLCKTPAPTPYKHASA